MKTLIVYATKYGCTEKCASMLAKKLTGEVELLNLNSGKAQEIGKYDKVIIGGSIYIGKIQKEVSEFCEKNLTELKNKKIGLFICGMQEGEAIESEIKAGYPESLLTIATAKACFGGEFILSNMKFLDKLIVKNITKTNKDVSKIYEENINSFAEQMN